MSRRAPTSLAEGRWLWRRLYVFANSALAWLILDRLITIVPARDALRLAEIVIMLLALMLVVYLVAPTAQQLLAGLSTLRRGGR